MIEACLLVTLLGLISSSRSAKSLINPFQIYFFIWFFILFDYYIFSNTYIKFPEIFLIFFLFEKIIELIFLLVINKRSLLLRGNKISISFSESHRHLILFAQILVLIGLPLAYWRAMSLTSDANIFSSSGYVELRRSLTDGGKSYGIFGYFSILSYVVSSVSVFLYKYRYISLPRIILSVTCSLFYIYFGTGRTTFLLFLCLMAVPLIMMNVIKIKGLIAFILIFILVFIFVAGMTGKGISTSDDLLNNLKNLFNNLRSYTVAPLLAFSQLFSSSPAPEWGINTFRFIIAIANHLGIINIEPANLIKNYSFVPDPTNVYTVYAPYFRDFSYFGLAAPMIFLMAHYFIYRKAAKNGGAWVFYYAASVFPLFMQFFQDQYFSLFSMWLQIWFWFWLFAGNRKNILRDEAACA